MDVFTLNPGSSPLLISIPHAGTELPDDLKPRLTETALALPDTDWHVPRLYAFAHGLGAGVLAARFSRYLIDLNRPPGGESLYPGQVTTGLCPTETFAGEPIYRPGTDPTPAEITLRRERFWRPYHDVLGDELERLRARHGFALLFEAHSIASRVPRLFEGRLPDLNLGTVHGASCAPDLECRLFVAARTLSEFPAVLNGRFVGGYITRAYGNPERAVHAVQMELAQAAYMEEEAPWRYDEARAARLIPVLRAVIEAALAWRP